jgi:hypothetical protein
MGLMGGIFAPDNYARWPRLDHTNPDYLIDLNPKGRTAVVAAAEPASETAAKKDRKPEPSRSGHPATTLKKPTDKPGPT